jgi:hypothetical protein
LILNRNDVSLVCLLLSLLDYENRDKGIEALRQTCFEAETPSIGETMAETQPIELRIFTKTNLSVFHIVCLLTLKASSDSNHKLSKNKSIPDEAKNVREESLKFCVIDSRLKLNFLDFFIASRP